MVSMYSANTRHTKNRSTTYSRFFHTRFTPPSPSAQNPFWGEHPAGYSFLHFFAPPLPTKARAFAGTQEMANRLFCSDILLPPCPFGPGGFYYRGCGEVCQIWAKKTTEGFLPFGRFITLKLSCRRFGPVHHQTTGARESSLDTFFQESITSRPSQPGWPRSAAGSP